MWIRRIVYVLLLVGLALFFRQYEEWVSYYMLLMAAVLPVVSLLLSLPRTRLETKLQAAQKRCVTGMEDELTLSQSHGETLPQSSWISLSIEDLVGGGKEEYSLQFRQGGSETVALETGHCGAYRCDVTGSRICDMLGLFRLPMRKPEGFTVYVEPEERVPVPKPDLSRFRSVRFSPMAGGGFSEVHEMREYRPGDSMKSIHWKVSAKADKLMVREPQEAVWKKLMVTVDLNPNRRRLDELLGELLWICRRLLELGLEPTVCYIRPEDGQVVSQTVTDENSLIALLHRILETRIKKTAPTLAERNFPDADWRFHLGGEGAQQ